MHTYLPLVATALLGLRVSPTAAATASLATASIVDLSAELQYSDHHNVSPGAEALIDAIDSSSDNIRTVLVLEHGKIAMSYVRDDIDASGLYSIYSATKSWMSLIVGMLIDEGSLSLDETLGDVFDSNDSSIWPNVAEAEYMQSVTIEELLTMTSGLTDPPFSSESYSDIDWQDPTSSVEDLGGMHNYGGANLIDSLNYLDVAGTRGEFGYVLTSQIVGYVVLEKSGQTPKEFASERIFPLIGIAPDEIGWDENDDGMQHSFTGLRLNAYQMARFGQLFLQRGLASSDSRVISEEYVEQSLSTQVDASNMSYGYLFWKIDGAMMGMGSMDCAIGLGGQTICINDEVDRVSVLQMDIGLSESEYGMTMFRLALSAFSPATSFEGDEDGEETSSGDEANDSAGDDVTSDSSRIRLSIGPLLLAAIFSFL